MKIISKSISMRSASTDDADFIYSLRTERGEFLNNEHFTPEANKKWLCNYKPKEEQGLEYYFIISKEENDIGVVRVYDIKYNEKTFVWGSWILTNNSSPLYAVISALLVYEFSFKYLNLNCALLDVRNENKKVISFHEKSGAVFKRKDSLNSYFEFSRKDYSKFKSRYKKYLGYVQFIKD